MTHNFFTSLRKHAGLIVAVVGLFVFFALNLLVMQPTTQPVQAAIITPVVNVGRDGSRIATFFHGEAITQDTRVCFDLADMEIMDLQYQVDATDANTATVSLQQTNIDPTDGPFNAAQTVATVISTDANAFSQVGLFGRWNCIFADVTTSDPITFTIIGVAK